MTYYVTHPLTNHLAEILMYTFLKLARQRAINNSRVHRQITRLIRATVETGLISGMP